MFPPSRSDLGVTNCDVVETRPDLWRVLRQCSEILDRHSVGKSVVQHEPEEEQAVQWARRAERPIKALKKKIGSK